MSNLVKQESLPVLSAIEAEIVENHMMGKSNREVALALGVETKVVTGILNRDDVRQYLSVAQPEFELARKDRMLSLMNRVIDDRIKKIEEDEDADFSGLSRKDTVDIILAMDGIQKEAEKAKLGSNQNNVYINLVNQLMD